MNNQFQMQKVLIEQLQKFPFIQWVTDLKIGDEFIELVKSVDSIGKQLQAAVMAMATVACVTAILKHEDEGGPSDEVKHGVKTMLKTCLVDVK